MPRTTYWVVVFDTRYGYSERTYGPDYDYETARMWGYTLTEENKYHDFAIVQSKSYF